MKPLGYSDTKLACLAGAGRIKSMSFLFLLCFLLARYFRIHLITKMVRINTVITSKIVSRLIHDMELLDMLRSPRLVVFSSLPTCRLVIGAFLLHNVVSRIKILEKQINPENK